MGTRAKMNQVHLKDVYEKIQNNEITKYEFQQWLSMYAYKHYNKGIEFSHEIWEDVLHARADGALTMEDIRTGNYKLS